MADNTILYRGRIYKNKLPLIIFIKEQGIFINEGGSGFIFYIQWHKPYSLYFCFWTNRFAPRFFISWDDGLVTEISCDP